MINIIKSLLSAEKNTLSSKRLCGITGWIVCLLIAIYCTIAVVEAPTITYTIVIASAALLGVSNITDVWKNN